MMTEYREQRKEGRRQKTEDRGQRTEERGERRSLDTANRHFSWYSFCLFVSVVYCMSILWEAFFWKRC